MENLFDKKQQVLIDLQKAYLQKNKDLVYQKLLIGNAVSLGFDENEMLLLWEKGANYVSEATRDILFETKEQKLVRNVEEIFGAGEYKNGCEPLEAVEKSCTQLTTISLFE